MFQQVAEVGAHVTPSCNHILVHNVRNSFVV